MKALYKNEVVAQSDATIVIEGNHYFPRESVSSEFLEQSSHTSTCPWKGEAVYFNVTVNGETASNAAWSYPEPKEKALEIAGYIAFWGDVEVRE